MLLYFSPDVLSFLHDSDSGSDLTISIIVSLLSLNEDDAEVIVVFRW